MAFVITAICVYDVEGIGRVKPLALSRRFNYEGNESYGL